MSGGLTEEMARVKVERMVKKFENVRMDDMDIGDVRYIAMACSDCECENRKVEVRRDEDFDRAVLMTCKCGHLFSDHVPLLPGDVNANNAN